MTSGDAECSGKPKQARKALLPTKRDQVVP